MTKSSLTNHWFGYVIAFVAICALCVFFAGPKGILYAVGYFVLYFLSQIFTKLISPSPSNLDNRSPPGQ